MSSLSHLHRTGRIDAPLIDVALFAGRYVVRSLAASDEVATAAECEGDHRLLALVSSS